MILYELWGVICYTLKSYLVGVIINSYMTKWYFTGPTLSRWWILNHGKCGSVQNGALRVYSLVAYSTCARLSMQRVKYDWYSSKHEKTRHWSDFKVENIKSANLQQNCEFDCLLQ